MVITPEYGVGNNLRKRGQNEKKAEKMGIRTHWQNGGFLKKMTNFSFYLDFFLMSHNIENNIPHSFQTMGYEAAIKCRFRLF